MNAIYRLKFPFHLSAGVRSKKLKNKVLYFFGVYRVAMAKCLGENLIIRECSNFIVA